MTHLAMMISLTHLVVQSDILLFAEMKIGVKRGIVEISLSINGSDVFSSSRHQPFGLQETPFDI
jgi:hypothetical protein